jgi:hypothetical protein
MDTTPLKEDAIPLFLSFCIEQYKNAKRISGKESLAILEKTGTLEYLEKFYEPIHTQSPQWILNEIDEYVNNH